VTVSTVLLYDLLPALYRLRDDDQRGEPLRQFLEVLTDQAAVIDESLAQLHDDLFVETAAPWVLPYIADLIGLKGLPGAESYGMTPRAEVANTIGYRRRKGTAAVLEQLARDVTGWPARAVEYFELLVGTQWMNHVRPHNESVVDIRDASRLEWVDSPFERLAGQTDLPHLVDVRRVASRRGRYNIPNVGIHVWRLRPYALTRSPAVAVDPADARRFLFSPLGTNTPLFTLPITEQEINHLAEPVNVPLPIGRRTFAAEPGTWYGPGSSLNVEGVDLSEVRVCDLRDVVDAGGVVTGWAHTPPPAGQVAIDPVLGRLAFADDRDPAPLVSYHYGFSADLGGGEYDRIGSFGDIDGPVHRVSQQDPVAVNATIADGLTSLGAISGTVEVADSGRYALPALDATGRRLELRGGDNHRPTLVLDAEAAITGDDDGELTLNGLLIVGAAVRVTGLRRLRLRHCTLVPGIALTTDGEPQQPGAPSLLIDSSTTSVEIEDCILGGLRAHPDSEVSVRGSIIDAGEVGVAYASHDGSTGGAPVRLENSTVLGKLHARVIDLASNVIFLARVASTDDPVRWPGPVLADRKQVGCVRFSYLPAGSRTPRRHRCQPERDADAARLRPVLTSERSADPGYCQLDLRTPIEIRRGADDESEMGVFHDLFQPQREHYLQTRLDEYLRFGLEAGIFFAS
jgi:hypothetical protein